MDLLISLYERLKKLREAGVKMKDIAEIAGIYSSVLSSLYSSVLPTYISLTESGLDEETSLDEALKQVNNISKRKLLSSISDIYEKVMKIEPHYSTTNIGNSPFIDNLYKETIKYSPNASIYSGLYSAYSQSSYSDGLKVEKYLITKLAEGENMPRVYCKSSLGCISLGAGVFPQNQIGYMFINETQMMSLALKIVYLQLPAIEYPKLIKGIYLDHDYNRNPIARRVILVRESDEISLEEFNKLEVKVIEKDDIDEKLMSYYNYTCCKEDIIRSLFVVSPDKNTSDLELEKKMLELL